MPASRQRRAAQRRRLRRQAQRRQQYLARRRRSNLLLSLLGALLVVGIVVALIVVTKGSSDAGSRTGASTPPPSRRSTAASSPAARTSAAAARTSAAAARTSSAASASAVATTTACSYPRSGTAARRVTPPPAKAAATGTATVVLSTSQGSITFTLNRATAPCAVNSFVSLARQKYYNGTACHRLVTRSIFLLQCGDPTGTGRGGPGYRFADELGTDPTFRRGVVVMANGGPNTNGSQFFLIDRDSRLGAGYTPLGAVTSGLAVVDRVERAGTSDGSSDGPPKLRLAFRTMTVS